MNEPNEWLEYAGEPPELLPCPFCGTKPDPPYEVGGFWNVYCDRCDYFLTHNGPHNVSQAWNNRPAPDEQRRKDAAMYSHRPPELTEKEPYTEP
jgi:hypothetical protein